MNDFFAEWARMLPDLLVGLAVSVQLTVLGLLIGLPLGVVLAAGNGSRSAFVRWPIIVLVELGRGAPALILLYIVYYGLPQANILLSAFPSAVATMAIVTGAYSAEVFRAGLEAVPVGQREASRALGLSAFNEFRLVVLPQAVKIVIPPLIGLSIIVFQGTSLAYAISVRELLSRAYNAGTVTFDFLPPLTLAGLIYAVVSLSAIVLLRSRRPRRSGRRLQPATPALDAVQI